MGLHDRTNTALQSLRHPGSQLHQRGVSLATVMDFGGRHFKSNVGPKDHAALSFPTDKYDIFVSHSWRTSRRAKYAALLYHTSLFPAVCAGLAAGILAFALQVQGILPPFGIVKAPPPLESLPGSMWCQLMGGCTFFAILVMWTRLAELAKSTRGTKVSCFLDCLCINQSDAELKQVGIDSIGAYLRNSDSMLVLWGPEYFTRLWCCFELAVFMEKSTNVEFKSLLQNSLAEMRPTSVGAARDLQRNTSPSEMNNEETAPARIAAVATAAQGTRNETHDRKLIIIPVQMGVFCIYCLLFGYVSSVVAQAMSFLDSKLSDLFWALSMFGGCVAICRNCRRYSHDRLELSNQIAQFTVCRAECFSPLDHEFIEAMITCLYSETLDEVEGIASFEYVVRSRVQQNVDKILGSRMHVPWRLSIAGSFLVALRELDAVAQTLMVSSHLAGSEVLADRTAKQAARAFSHVSIVYAFLYCAIATGCLLPNRKSKLAEFASNAMFILVTSCFLCFCAVFVSGQFEKMPALESIPLYLIFGLLLLSGPACCNYVSCRFSLRKNQEEASSSNQEAGQEGDQEPGEQESREETHWEQGDCEQVLEPSELQEERV
ncbi:unnamed protein product [Polarella glacialis]|uniref:Uncharacterized protein n=1 Tax=Polarella glacialis TaxID=89957 RepID=A0A813EQD1_POLGL|nr:unnamed protein product [Polarella glacialis]CAE8600672.1 unnamed protein product [Polarella glacialis]CAE8693308.1 unnamed protein product [Polarella glacialis]